MSDELRRRVEYTRNIRGHLQVLERLTGRQVVAGELLDPQATWEIKQSIRAEHPPQSPRSIRVPFSELSGDRFRSFVTALADVAAQPVQVWIDTTESCGLLVIESLRSFNFSFEFSDEPSGLIVLRTVDLLHRLLLDFSDEGGRQEVQIEWSGPSWKDVEY